MMKLLLSCVLFSFSSNVCAESFDNDNQYSIAPTPTTEVVMINFDKQEEVDFWRITNDSVMGGKSNGMIQPAADHGIFKGSISLENNGGFSSVFRSIKPLSKQLDTISIDIKGDGKVYQLRMAVSIEGYRLTYKHDFNTVAGKRERINFMLADFQATFRGREITNVPVLTAEKIQEVGFLIKTKVSSSFSLAIYHLMFLKA